jgi:hypothetical protein
MFKIGNKEQSQPDQTVVKVHISSRYYSEILIFLTNEWRSLNTNIPDIDMFKINRVISELDVSLSNYLQDQKIELYEKLDDDGKDYVVSSLLNEFLCSKLVHSENLLFRQNKGSSDDKK